MLEVVLSEAPDLNISQGFSLLQTAQKLLFAFPSECHSYARFQGMQADVDSRYVIDEFRSGDLEHLIWDFENVLAGRDAHSDQFMLSPTISRNRPLP
jgi:hypothetical protein